MEAVRTQADLMEALCAKDRWPFPSYGDLLFSVK
jgi:glutamine synthetase type III